ncbi:MAG: response regulator [Acidobacteria bacterium]|nr:response regulator [Acidobacteriota bacterium]
MTDDATLIRVLVVDDEPIAADAHAHYVQRCPGFELVGTAGTAAEGVRLLREAAAAGSPVDLLLLDMNLPDLNGLDLSRRLRSAGITVDIMAITAVRELDVIRQAISGGVVAYLIKPFRFAALADKLENYRSFRQQLEPLGPSPSQHDVDQALASLRSPGVPTLPKGLSADSLSAVARLLREGSTPLSATEVSELLPMSRVSARRYLEQLQSQGQVLRSPRYGTPGRPENEYSWRSN